MSVRTTADEHLDTAKDNLKDAIENLSKTLSKDTWGSDDFSAIALRKFNKALHDLREVDIALNDHQSYLNDDET